MSWQVGEQRLKRWKMRKVPWNSRLKLVKCKKKCFTMKPTRFRMFSSRKLSSCEACCYSASRFVFVNVFWAKNSCNLFQESLDQMNKSKQDQDQIQNLKAEIARIKSIEQNFEDVKVSFLCKTSSNLLSAHRKVSFFILAIFTYLEKEKLFWWLFFFFPYHFLVFLIQIFIHVWVCLFV